jgi:NAD(P)-dependent dehydrogenase (short-subunit alcohol dehydrogenase family)
MHPLGRLGTPGDIANALFFLLSPDNTWITGQTISVDGGLSSLQTK